MMEVLKSLPIEKKLGEFHYFDLTSNNERLGVISISNLDNCRNQLKQIFSDIISNKKINFSYYQLRNIFVNSQAYDSEIVLKLLAETVEKKVDIIAHVLSTSREGITMGQYIQIWAEYREFCQQLYHLLNIHQKFLTERNIKVSNISNNILSIIQLCTFYNKIFSMEPSILDMISSNEFNLDSHNVDQFVNFISALRIFLSMQKFTQIDKTRITETIKKHISGAQRINLLCGYVHKILLEVGFADATSNKSNKSNIATIYKVVSMLAVYGEKEPLLVSHSKFMKARIINPKYTNLELEIELVKRISGAVGKYESQKMLDSISDIIQSRTLTEILHKSTVKVVSDEYSKIDCLGLKNITPLILGEKNWKIGTAISELAESEFPIVYPPEIKYCLNIVSKFFSKINPDNLDCGYIIQWVPFLGRAKFTADFKHKSITIGCNFLQAIALEYSNRNRNFSIQQFVLDTHINQNLAHKLFESLTDGGLLVCIDPEQKLYAPNVNNYVGESNIDLHALFIETFNPEKPTDIAKSKFSYIADYPETAQTFDSVSTANETVLTYVADDESIENDIPTIKPSNKISSDFSSDESDD
jgi:hypothetical protein